jgi:hypothetical protein
LLGPIVARARPRILPPAFLTVIVLSLAVTLRLEAALVINEFLPDPAGADAGKEFVELLNTGALAVDLAGVRLEFANGAEGPVWSVRWTGGDSLSLGPGQRFLIVDRNWQGAPAGQAEVYLGLQNGPDAIRLSRGPLVLDLVGYGALTDPLMMEGGPAPMAVGLAVARRPDGRDTQDNSLDFVAHQPSPGLANFLDHELQVRDLVLDPASADRAGLRLSVVATLRNAGTEELGPGEVLLRGFGQEGRARLDALPPDQERTLAWFLTPSEEGRHPLRVVLPLAGIPDSLVVSVGAYQVGPGELYLSEVLPDPGAGQGEWIEVGNPGSSPLWLPDFRLRDEDGAWGPLPPAWLGPGQVVVLAQDPGLLEGWMAANREAGNPHSCPEEELPGAVLGLEGGWPSLNNTPPADRVFADRIYLADSLGTVIDQVTLGDPDHDQRVPGVSWERIALRPRNPTGANWAPSTAPAGATCACTNSVDEPLTGAPGLTVTPGILSPEQGTSSIHLQFEVPAGARGWQLQIFDTWGGLVRDLGGDMAGPGPRDLLWDGRGDGGQFLPVGAYIPVLSTLDAQGLVVGLDKALALVSRGGGP